MSAANQWVRVARTEDFPADTGACVKVGEMQIAVFNFSSRGEWYACQNNCPHKHDMVLSRGLLGDLSGEPQVACPQHKKTFSLQTGKNLGGEEYCIRTFPVKVEGHEILLGIEDLNS
ncbi:MAG: nitrite reductase small subunit NirD [Candidatus Latescibacteria bacterium]|nr:nitrite reductase small subunit NirD [Candidatus Latescibacterota bacterium]